MHPGWKISLVASLLFAAAMFGEWSLRPTQIITYLSPLAIWLTSRWVLMDRGDNRDEVAEVDDSENTEMPNTSVQSEKSEDVMSAGRVRPKTLAICVLVLIFGGFMLRLLRPVGWFDLVVTIVICVILGWFLMTFRGFAKTEK